MLLCFFFCLFFSHPFACYFTRCHIVTTGASPQLLLHLVFLLCRPPRCMFADLLACVTFQTAFPPSGYVLDRGGGGGEITKNTVSTCVPVNSSPQLLETSGSHRSGRPTLISSYVQSYFWFLCKQHINAAPTPPPCSLQKARAPLLASWCLAMKHPLTVLRCCQTRRADVFHGCPELSRAEQSRAAAYQNRVLH